MALSVVFAFVSLIVSTVGTGHIPAGVIPSISWAGDKFPESVFFGLAMVLTATQITFVYFLYDGEFRFLWRAVLFFLALGSVVGLLILSVVSVGNDCTTHGVAALIAFFFLYAYVSLRLYILWRNCRSREPEHDGKMRRFKASLWILLGLFLISVPVSICCFVFFGLYAATNDPYSLYYLFFVIFEWTAGLVVDAMHITTWAAYNVGFEQGALR